MEYAADDPTSPGGKARADFSWQRVSSECNYTQMHASYVHLRLLAVNTYLPAWSSLHRYSSSQLTER